MNTPIPPGPGGSSYEAKIAAARIASWQLLLAEMSELHARVEYLSLLLKLGVRRV